MTIHNKEKPKGAKNYTIIVGVAILFFICLPYVWYSVLINSYLQANKPEDYRIARF